MGRKKDIIVNNITIDGVAAEGKCVTRHEGAVVFVKDVAPGDVIDLKITRKKKSFFEGYPLKIHEFSKVRQEPFCEHFGTCGGCKWQHIQYEEQLKYKQQQVEDNLQRIGKVAVADSRNILPSAETTYYRNKLEYTFTNWRWLTREEIDSGEEVEGVRVVFVIWEFTTEARSSLRNV